MIGHVVALVLRVATFETYLAAASRTERQVNLSAVFTFACTRRKASIKKSRDERERERGMRGRYFPAWGEFLGGHLNANRTCGQPRRIRCRKISVRSGRSRVAACAAARPASPTMFQRKIR